MRKANEHVESLRVTCGGGVMAAARYTKNENGLEWRTTIVFSQEQAAGWIGIRISCESRHPSARLPIAKKPVLVRTLLNRFAGAFDGPFAVQAKPIRLDNADIDVAARCIRGDAGCRLPMVYVSSRFQGGPIVDVDRLADRLAGMAHVVVEPNRAFSVRLRMDVEAQNVYGGTIGIYWPDGGGRRSFFIGPQYDSPREIEDGVCDEVRAALANRRPQANCTRAAVQERVSRRVLARLKEEGTSEIDEYAEEFDKELSAKDEQLRDANNEIGRLQAEVRKYEAWSPLGAGLVLQTGQEQDLYDGELIEVVRDAISDAVGNQVDDGRRQHILTAILESSAASQEARSNREHLKDLLRNYRSMDAKTRRGLGEMGFSIKEDGKHYKLTYQGDERYTFTLPKSGSDHRGGLNAASDIGKRLF